MDNPGNVLVPVVAPLSFLTEMEQALILGIEPSSIIYIGLWLAFSFPTFCIETTVSCMLSISWPI